MGASVAQFGKKKKFNVQRKSGSKIKCIFFIFQIIRVIVILVMKLCVTIRMSHSYDVNFSYSIV